MTERLINIQAHWSGTPDEQGVERAPWTFTGVTVSTRNDDGSDPPSAFVPKALMNPQLVTEFETSAFPALVAARAARIAALEPPEQRAARLKEEAEAKAAQAETRAAQAETRAAELAKDIEQKLARAAELDDEIATKEAQVEDAKPE